MRYQIEHFTLCDGWVNTWRDDSTTPVTFASYDEALKELNEYYKELNEDVESGSIEPYNMCDFRIAEVTL
jgi:hypothetical protein